MYQRMNEVRSVWPAVKLWLMLMLYAVVCFWCVSRHSFTGTTGGRAIDLQKQTLGHAIKLPELSYRNIYLGAPQESKRRCKVTQTE